MSRFFSRWCSEPFRVCFPLGLLCSVMGVALWPLYFKGLYPDWPLEAHTRWMVPGFVGWLVTGFLGTSGPRLLGTSSWSKIELTAILGFGLAAMIALGFRKIEIADLCFAFWFGTVVATLLRRFVFQRKDIPPPGLPAALLGLLGAALAALALAATRWLEPSVAQWTFLRLLYFQGLIWLPIIAVAPYLLPRFFEKASPHAFPESLTPPPGWWQPFVLSLLATGLIIASFVIEAAGATRGGLLLRATTVGAYLFFAVPGLFSLGRTNGAGIALRCVIPCALGGWFLAALWPDNALRVRGMLHLMFIAGASLLMFTVMTRVILGHADRHDRLKGPMKWYYILTSLLLFTAATRLTSDFFLSVRISHFTYAAGLWGFLVLFFLWKIRQELHTKKPDDFRILPPSGNGLQKRKCPIRK